MLNNILKILQTSEIEWLGRIILALFFISFIWHFSIGWSGDLGILVSRSLHSMVIGDGAEERNNLSLLVWVDLLGAGLEEMQSLATFV